MAIKFETLNMPESTCKQEVSEEQKSKIAKRVKKIRYKFTKNYEKN